MNKLQHGPLGYLISCITENDNTASLQQLQLQFGPEIVGKYQNFVQNCFFENQPCQNAISFSFTTGCMSAVQAFLWGSFFCLKVSALAGGFAGGILGGACGILKASQLRFAGEESQPFTKTIRDYAIRGKSVGTVYSHYLSVVPAMWLGIKVTILAAPVVTVSIPLLTALSALSGVEYAYRGNRSIGYRIIDTVFEYTMPLKYYGGFVKDIQMAHREREVPFYPNLEARDIPPGLQHPLPRTAVLCVGPAELHENEITEQANYHVYDYEVLKSAFLNDENYVFTHNGKPVDWDLVFRLTNHSLQ